MNALRQFSTKRLLFIFRFVKYTNFIKRSKNIKEKKENTDTRSHCCVTSRAEYKPPLGMHVALSFKEVHEVGEWEIMPSTRFLSAAGKHNLPPLFFSPFLFFFFFEISISSFLFLRSFASLRLIDERRMAECISDLTSRRTDNFPWLSITIIRHQTYTGSILVAVNPYKEVDFYTNVSKLELLRVIIF